MRVMGGQDETLIRLDLCELLETAGHDVCARAKSGAEAVELARAVLPDAALLDVKMPRLDGIEAARRSLAERPIPIVMISAYTERALVERAVESGVVGYPAKPFREEEVAPALATAVGRFAELTAVPRAGRGARGGARRPEGHRAGEGDPDPAGAPQRARGVRTAPVGRPGVRAADARQRRSRDRDPRSGVREHLVKHGETMCFPRRPPSSSLAEETRGERCEESASPLRATRGSLLPEG